MSIFFVTFDQTMDLLKKIEDLIALEPYNELDSLELVAVGKNWKGGSCCLTNTIIRP